VPETEEARAVRLDREGKVLVDKVQREAEGIAFQRLQLTSELDEERQESSRKSAELKQMALLLKEKEALLAESAVMLADANRSNETLRERSEITLREKIEAVGELESLKSTMEEEAGKAKFQVMELEVSLNTLQTENAQLKAEIAEMSGDAMDSKPSGGKGRNTDVRMAQEEEATPVPVNKRVAPKAGGELGPGGSIAQSIADDPDRILSMTERKQLLEEYSTQFANICMQYHLDETVSSELYGIMDTYAEDLEKFFAALEDKLQMVEKSKGKRLRDLEEQRYRLEKDLQGRIENVRTALTCLVPPRIICMRR
jgi:DNA anti-recombination protein RmuC